jgi:hypothetical protein
VENFTAKFKRSFTLLQPFLDNWMGKIQEKCLGEDQRKASFYIWARYTMSIRTFHQICEPHYLPDIYVIARSCVEYDAFLNGFIADPRLAKDYLEFPDNARAYYGKVLERLGDSSRLAQLESDLEKNLGKDWRTKARDGMKWCNTSQLVEQYGGPAQRCLYACWSHFTHGSAIALEMLMRTVPSQDRLDTAVANVYGSYVLSTIDFLTFAWGRIVTQDSDSCKKEFQVVMEAWVR